MCRREPVPFSCNVEEQQNHVTQSPLSYIVEDPQNHVTQSPLSSIVEGPQNHVTLSPLSSIVEGPQNHATETIGQPDQQNNVILVLLPEQGELSVQLQQ